MIQLEHYLRKRKHVCMPRFSEYFKLSEKWRCWFPFFTSAIIALENIFAFLCSVISIFPLVYYNADLVDILVTHSPIGHKSREFKSGPERWIFKFENS